MDNVKLSDIGLGQKVLVLSIEDSELELALMRLGLMSGDEVTISDQAPLGGPIALRVPGGKVAIRRSDARHINVRRIA